MEGLEWFKNQRREMANLLIDDLNKIFRTDAEFHSVFIHSEDNANTLLKTSGAVSGRGSVSATYVTDKRCN